MNFIGIDDIDYLLKVAHIQQEMSWVKQYLNMPEKEKAIDLIYSNPWFASKVVKNNPENFSEDFVNKIEDSEFIFNDEWNQEGYSADAANLIQLVIKNLDHIQEDPDVPAWSYFDKAKVIQNQWMIHFTDEADSIAVNGFTNLVSDIRLLGLTTHIGPNSPDRSDEGYGFAYLANDFKKYAHNSRGTRGEWKYGSECVLFRASGIQAFHWGDEEPQTIFYGPTAKNIIPITGGDKATYAVGDMRGRQHRHKHKSTYIVYENDDLETVVDWAIANYDQYKNVISVR